MLSSNPATCFHHFCYLHPFSVRLPFLTCAQTFSQNVYPAFGLPEGRSFPGLAEVAEEVKLRHQLWASRKQWTATEADWLDAPLAQVRSIRVACYCYGKVEQGGLLRQLKVWFDRSLRHVHIGDSVDEPNELAVQHQDWRASRLGR
jgi:hypothetical protein